MKIIFFGTPRTALPILENLSKHHKVVAIVTLPDAPVGRSKKLQPNPVAKFAEGKNLPLLKPERVKSNTALLDELQTFGADVFIVVAYGKILPIELINLPPLKTLNVHFSRLPQYRGPSPVQYALLNGNKDTAVTMLILDEELDHGPILAQQDVLIKPADTFPSLVERMSEMSAVLLLKILPDYASGKLKPKEQVHSKASSTKIITKADGKINWEDTVEQIYNQFRAYTPWPGIWTTWQNQTFKILECLPSPTKSIETKKSGTILENGLVVCRNNTLLELKQVQLAGKKPADIKSFINGHRDFVGSSFD